MGTSVSPWCAVCGGDVAAGPVLLCDECDGEVGWCRLNLWNPRLRAPGTKRLNL